MAFDNSFEHKPDGFLVAAGMNVTLDILLEALRSQPDVRKGANSTDNTEMSWFVQTVPLDSDSMPQCTSDELEGLATALADTAKKTTGVLLISADQAHWVCVKLSNNPLTVTLSDSSSGPQQSPYFGRVKVFLSQTLSPEIGNALAPAKVGLQRGVTCGDHSLRNGIEFLLASRFENMLDDESKNKLYNLLLHRKVVTAISIDNGYKNSAEPTKHSTIGIALEYDLSEDKDHQQCCKELAELYVDFKSGKQTGNALRKLTRALYTKARELERLRTAEKYKKAQYELLLQQNKDAIDEAKKSVKLDPKLTERLIDSDTAITALAIESVLNPNPVKASAGGELASDQAAAIAEAAASGESAGGERSVKVSETLAAIAAVKEAEKAREKAGEQAAIAAVKEAKNAQEETERQAAIAAVKAAEADAAMAANDASPRTEPTPPATGESAGEPTTAATAPTQPSKERRPSAASETSSVASTASSTRSVVSIPAGNTTHRRTVSASTTDILLRLQQAAIRCGSDIGMSLSESSSSAPASPRRIAAATTPKKLIGEQAGEVSTQPIARTNDAKLQQLLERPKNNAADADEYASDKATLRDALVYATDEAIARKLAKNMQQGEPATGKNITDEVKEVEDARAEFADYLANNGDDLFDRLTEQLKPGQ